MESPGACFLILTVERLRQEKNVGFCQPELHSMVSQEVKPGRHAFHPCTQETDRQTDLFEVKAILIYIVSSRPPEELCNKILSLGRRKTPKINPEKGKTKKPIECLG